MYRIMNFLRSAGIIFVGLSGVLIGICLITKIFTALFTLLGLLLIGVTFLVTFRLVILFFFEYALTRKEDNENEVK